MKALILKTLAIFFINFQLIYGFEMMDRYNHWNSYVNTTGKPYMLLWNNTYLRVSHFKPDCDGGLHMLHLHSVDPMYEPHVYCEIPLSREFHIVEYINYATSLRNKKIVIRMGTRAMIVDMDKCSSVELKSEVHQIQSYHDYFDAITYMDDYSDNSTMNISRYSHEGQLDVAHSYTNKPMVLNMRKMENSTSGRHYYAIKSCNKKSELLYLNSTYDIVERREYEHSIVAVSFANDHMSFSFYYKEMMKHWMHHPMERYNYKLQWKRMDSNMKTQANATFNVMKSDNLWMDQYWYFENRGFYMHNLSDGGAILVYKDVSEHDKKHGVVMYRHMDANGHVLYERMLFSTEEFSDHYYYEDFDFFLFEVNVAEGFYCAYMVFEKPLYRRCFKV